MSTLDKVAIARSPISVQIFQSLAIAGALEFYAKHGQQVNRGYTPGAMMATARRLTNQHFKPRAYTEAALALRQHAAKLKESLP